jgi:predicted DNA-binding transcriptional regulator AlpA
MSAPGSQSGAPHSGLGTHEAPERLLTVPEVAACLSVSEKWVRAHAEEMGVIRLGRLLRFDPGVIREWITCCANRNSAQLSARESNGSAGTAAGRTASVPNRVPEPGSILRVRPMTGGDRGSE